MSPYLQRRPEIFLTLSLFCVFFLDLFPPSPFRISTAILSVLFSSFGRNSFTLPLSVCFLLGSVYDINLELTIFLLIFICFPFAAHDPRCLSFHLFFQSVSDLFISWFAAPPFLIWSSRGISNPSSLCVNCTFKLMLSGSEKLSHLTKFLSTKR